MNDAGVPGPRENRERPDDENPAALPTPLDSEMPQVTAPRIPDMDTSDYAPSYEGAGAQPPAPPPPTPPTRPHSAPPPGPAVPQFPAAPGPQPFQTQPFQTQPPPGQPFTPGESSTRRPDRWKALIAPVAAGVILLMGAGFLVLRTGGDSRGSTPETTEKRDRDRPDTTVESPETTVETRRTSPPLMEVPPAITTPDTATPTSTRSAPDTASATTPPPVAERPTGDDLRNALVTINDLTSDDWILDTFDDSDDGPCSDPDALDTVVEESVLFSRTETDPIAVRQLTHSIYAYSDAATAQDAFDRELDTIRACNGTTADISGVTYDVSTEISRFDDTQSATFPCADDNALIIAQFTNGESTTSVPFLGVASAVFRCGSNIVLVAFASTVDLDDLSNDEYTSVAVTANIRAASLPGSE